MTFRKDIQMLRGIAVLLVVLFHLQVSIVKSGFLGVDVFFVISGFLMAILYDPTKKKEFFLRRSKRLLPTYFVVILLTLSVSIFVTIPNEYYQVIKQSIYATFFSSNIGFWMQSSYFSKSHFNPLLHLWSLGVEIQFYLIVPLLYWIFKKSKIFLPLILFLSLIGCFIVVGISTKTSFFMMPFRLWEFLIGYCIAVYFTNNGNIRNPSFSWMGIIAFLVLIIVPTFNLNGDTLGFVFGHPGMYALFLSLATGVVLAYGIPKIIQESKIGTSLAVLGKYSYSIYLVHFPVIVLFLYEPFSGTILKTNSLGLTMILLLLIIVLSILMYHLVENPARHSKKIIRHMLIAPLLIFIFIFIGYIFQQSVYSKQEQLIFNAWKDRAPYRCGKMIRIVEPTAISCNIVNELQNYTQKILLVGNSHADAIKSTFASVSEELNVDVRFIVQNNPLMKGGLSPQIIINEAVEKKINTIVLHYSPKVLDIVTIKKLISLAENNDILVAFIMPVPVWDRHIPEALFNKFKKNESLPIQTREDYQVANKNLKESLSSISNKNFLLYEVITFLCPEECQMISPTGAPFYFDDDHLTLTGSELLRPLFYRIITDTINIQQLEYTK